MFSEQFGEILTALASLTTPQLETLQAMLDRMRAEGIRNPSVETGQPLLTRQYTSRHVWHGSKQAERQRTLYRDTGKSWGAAKGATSLRLGQEGEWHTDKRCIEKSLTAGSAAERADILIGTAFFQYDLLPQDVVEHESSVVSARQEVSELSAANIETCGGVSALNARDLVDRLLDASAATAAAHEVPGGDKARNRRDQSFKPAQGIPITPEELGLTQRQGAVLVQLLEGLPNKLIARNLGLSINTVKEHVSAVLLRLDLRTRSQVIPWMNRLNEHDRSFKPAQSVSITPEELGLTQRQGAVLVQLLEGLPNKVIARNLGLSINTVKEHVSAILLRLDLRTRSQVISRMKQFRVRTAE
nr:LuxR C-terminal-related transcriptional regulator [Cupriavidus lacunae]